MYYAYKKTCFGQTYKNQVHLGRNHATSFLINTLVDIMFAVLKNELEILDYMYSKMQSRTKMFVSLVHSTVGKSVVCD